MREKKRFTTIFLVVIIFVLILMNISFKMQNKAFVSAEKSQDFCIVIDPGHGGFDGGAVAEDGTSEKDINLSISHYLKEVMEGYDISVVMTRYKDESLCGEGESIRSKKKEDMHRRRLFIEDANADLTISIHLNSYPSDASVYGAQVFYPAREQKRTDEQGCEQVSKNYAEEVQKSLEINIQDGRERVAMAKGDTYLLKNINSPYILVECGFLSNIEECEMLKTADYQRLLAESIWKGINTILGLEPKQKIQIIHSANKEEKKS